jgi:hypothetical protein
MPGDLFWPRRKSLTSVWRPFKSSIERTPHLAKTQELQPDAVAAVAAAAAPIPAAAALLLVPPSPAPALLLIPPSPALLIPSRALLAAVAVAPAEAAPEAALAVAFG